MNRASINHRDDGPVDSGRSIALLGRPPAEASSHSANRVETSCSGLDFLRRGVRWIGVLVALATIAPATSAPAQELKYPQIIKIRYEAQDPRIGGHFVIWVEREKIWYGLDSRLYPAAKSVEVTHVTPTAGSITLTTIAVTKVNSAEPDYFHLSGNVRFKISGMSIKSTNAP